MKKLLLTVSLLLTTNLNFAMSPLVKNLSKLNRKITPNHIAQNLPCLLNQKRNDSAIIDVALLGFLVGQSIQIHGSLQNIETESKRTNDLLEMQNRLLEEQLKAKNSDDTIKQN